MKRVYSLSDLEWTLTGWHPWWWRMGQSMELGTDLGCVAGPVKAKVPGSVQQALKEAGELPDWNYEINTQLCEWVENRHWAYEAVLPDEELGEGAEFVLNCQGLDYKGVVRLNGKEIGEFANTMVPHTFDLTPHLTPEHNVLTLIFTEIPRYLGQIDYTSRITQWKPRFNYIWDWVPRLVQVGIWDEIALEVRSGDYFEALRLYTDYEAACGIIQAEAELALAAAERVRISVHSAQGVVKEATFPAEKTFSAKLEGLEVAPWWPNGLGAQPLYEVQFELLDAAGQVMDSERRRVGFRRVEWRPCEGAPEGAEPWVCVVNGQPLFLQGANWVPPLPNFADVTSERYVSLLHTYRKLGFNLLRVWGGAVLEREEFYSLCDELGILVWQEFPLSSSGLDNWPPEDEQAIKEMETIVASYVARRQHHPSLIIWCGGNELQDWLDGSKAGVGKPVDATHPMIGAMKRIVERMDPTRRFLPTSPSGPRSSAHPKEFGKGLHHDVHGPWNYMGGTWEDWQRYWDHDDALFRSETGLPGASSVELIRLYGGKYATPISRRNPFWRHTGGWWVDEEAFKQAGGDLNDLEGYVKWSQQRQAEGLKYAAASCKRRFPRCGGFVIWMGHDCYPCPANTAVIDFHGNPKPAALALSEVFHTPPEAL